MLFLSGCATTYPTDLAVSSVQAVERRDVAELPPPFSKNRGLLYDPYKNYMRALAKRKAGSPIEPKDVEGFFKEYAGNKKLQDEKRDGLLLKVEFKSNENLLNLTRQKGYTLANKSYLCANKDREVILGRTNIYWRGLNLSYAYNYGVQEEKGKPFTYYAFITPKFLEALPGAQMIHERIPTNDLIKYPEDVCFQIKGGFMFTGFKSNVVVISAEQITKAFSLKQ